MNKFEQPSQDEEKEEKKLKFDNFEQVKVAIFRNELNEVNAQENIVASLKEAGQELSHQQEQSIGNALVQLNLKEDPTHDEKAEGLESISKTIFEILQEKE